MAGVVFDLARQGMVLADVFDDGEHRQPAPGAAHPGAAPAAPDQAAVATAEAQFARPQLAVPVDAPHSVDDQLTVHQQVTQRQLQQHVAAMVEDIGHRLVGLDHLAFGVELEHADVGLVERCAETALVLGQVLADAARQGDRHQADRQHRQARDHQGRQPHQRGHPQQCLRERLALHLHPLVQVTQLLQVVVACGNGHQAAVVPQLQFIDQSLQRHQVAIGLPPQRARFAEGTDVARVAEREHQAWDVGARVAALQEALPGFFLVRFGLFQRQSRLQVAQRHLQGLACVVQVLGIAARQVATECGSGILLATRPVALAGDPGSGGRLQFLDQGGQSDQSDRHARQQRKSQSQPPGHRHPSAVLVRATPTHPGSP